MKFFSDIRLLLLSVWLGAAVFFIGVAQVAFAVLQDKELAGTVVGRCLTILNLAGIGITVILILSSFVAAARIKKIWLWIERFLLVILGGGCAVSQFVVGLWIASVRGQMGKPIDELASDDPLRAQFDMLHQYSIWLFVAGIVAALLVFFIISNRKFSDDKASKDNIYDFSKEFKV